MEASKYMDAEEDMDTKEKVDWPVDAEVAYTEEADAEVADTEEADAEEADEEEADVPVDTQVEAQTKEEADD